MPYKWKGLYYELMDKRNFNLNRNIGEYNAYKTSLLVNGGLAIGMGYGVEGFLSPTPLADRSQDIEGKSYPEKKEKNPEVEGTVREGGLFGYTHEVINPDNDFLSRSKNIRQTYYDYPSTADNFKMLDEFPDSLPWDDALRLYSSAGRGSETFSDYRDYAGAAIPEGLTFQDSLGEGYRDRLLINGFNTNNIDGGARQFIDERAGSIAGNPGVMALMDDTYLGYVGKIILGEEKLRAVYADGKKSVSPLYELPMRPGITDPFYGMNASVIDAVFDEREKDVFAGAGNNNLYSFMRDIDDPAVSVTYDTIDEFVLGDHQKNYLKGHIRRNQYKNIYLSDDDYRYVDYYNISDYGSTTYIKEEDKDIPVVEHGWSGSNFLGESVEGFFRGVGDYDWSLQKNEHYDEQDGINSGERDILSRKISYNETETLGFSNQIGFSSKSSSLLEKTKRLFQEHKIKTLIGRFHTSNDDKGSKSESLIQSALNYTYGISHGRNLLKADGPDYTENGYENPYCRVWTYHHQYSKMTDLIRPFIKDDSFMDLDKLHMALGALGRPNLDPSGRRKWSEYSVLNKNGLVNIAPMRGIGDGAERIKAKQCMFSIENLAWKDVHNNDINNLDAGEIGPLGGRIMWFPPYNLSFNESVSVSWGSNDFIGRGERIYSYTNTERSGSLSFTILADHPSIVDYWMQGDGRMNKPASEDDQQSLLRFYAGCEIITGATPDKAVPYEPDNNNIKENTGSKMETGSAKPEPDQKDKTDPQPAPTIEETIDPGPPPEITSANSIGFYVYYPNNLSCYDYVSDPAIAVNYLINGKNGFNFTSKTEGRQTMMLDETGRGTAMVNGTIMYCDGPGYEMGGHGFLTTPDEIARIQAHNTDKANDDALNYIWGYGIDKIYIKQRLCGPNKRREIINKNGKKVWVGNGKIFPYNYCDKVEEPDPTGPAPVDTCLNATPNEYDPDCLYSFIDVAVALSKDFKYSGKGEDLKRVSDIKEKLGIDDTGEVANNKRKFYFTIAGGASVHGYGDENDGLSKRRANFIKAWLTKCFEKNNLNVSYADNAKIPIKTGIAGGEEDLDVNSESAKRGRYAKAVIYWNDEETKDATDAAIVYEPDSGSEQSAVTVTIQEKVFDPDKTNTTDDSEAAGTSSTKGTSDTQPVTRSRYGDEERFFKLVKESDPVLFKNIVDKVKYFDPVYHSITPEGFNSRLSFLHQCTRQGPTLSTSDLSDGNGVKPTGYAGNLSFGRAPICVLRLGDFYNTRIIINSIQIQYETNQWDLNPEGIGVQPMLANVTISFVFQGGSSLAGPIQRLQNAVSFNYYANQEVYDDRADVAVYNGTELSNETKVWLPNMGIKTLNEITKMQEPVEPAKRPETNADPQASPITGQMSMSDASEESDVEAGTANGKIEEEKKEAEVVQIHTSQVAQDQAAMEKLRNDRKHMSSVNDAPDANPNYFN